MTRETKIGLLVGLAFIIVIGILLSDHMTSTTQPQQAKLDEAASNVRESVSSPASATPPPSPVTSRQITPANPVPTQAELRAPVQQQPAVAQQQPTGVTQVQVGGPVAPQAGSPIAIRQDMPIVPQTPQAPQPQNQQQQPIVAEGNSGNAGSNLANSSLEEFANSQGVPIVPVNGGGNANQNNNHPTPPAAPKPTDTTAAAAGGHEYVAQAGDSLSRIVSRQMGTNSKANREAFVKANPSLQKNPDVIIEGRKYVIPAAAAVKVATATGTESKPAPAKPANGGTAKAVPVTDLVEPLPGASAAAAAAGDTYVVKENDNLWKIAAEQLGSGNAWQQIRDMNKDVLKGGDTVQVNMRLRLPPKPVASAAN